MAEGSAGGVLSSILFALSTPSMTLCFLRCHFPIHNIQLEKQTISEALPKSKTQPLSSSFPWKLAKGSSPAKKQPFTVTRNLSISLSPFMSWGFSFELMGYTHPPWSAEKNPPDEGFLLKQGIIKAVWNRQRGRFLWPVHPS